ncbi:MAG: NAD(P)/FAD-dependent oxidoreductase [Coriobacteriales bacterium]|jgi:thioredoxin reductase (NADPH)|nr:NAD(P)/FAD-dependent oxidoreductase [Coriobacteriales bacterium]
MYDIAVIGGGPAGLSAAITARARNKEVLVVSNPAQENPLATSRRIDNYPGLPAVSGLALLKTMHAQAHDLKARFLQARVITVVPVSAAPAVQIASQDTQITRITAQKTTFAITTSNDYLEAKSVIIACGATSSGKAYPGEQEYLGRGVSYCATCDGMLYRQATVVVAGLSPEAVEEANFLAELGATVHYVAKKLPQSLDARIHRHAGRLLSIEGDALGVTHCVISERRVACTGVFLLRPGVAPKNLLPGLAVQDGYIQVDAAMRTNIEGVFAAGDATGKPLQIAKAVGQGQIAALSAAEYLA